MSKRMPVSAATRRYEALLAHNAWLARAIEGVGDEPDAVECAQACANGLYGDAALRARARGPEDIVRALLQDPYGVPPSTIAWTARWRRCRQVYRVDRTVAEELADQPLDGRLPIEAMRTLPYPVVYVDGRVEVPAGGDAVGFLAWVMESDHARDELYLDFISPGGSEWCTSVPLEGAADLGEAVSKIVSESLMTQRDVGIEMATPDPDGLARTLTHALNLLLYIVSKEADAEVVYSPPSGGRGQKAGARTNPETVRVVGARMGRAIGAARRAATGGGTGGKTPGRTVAPHVRRAHWQHYWTGPRKGRDDGRHGDALVLRWVPPTYVNGDGSEVEVVHEG